MALVKYCMSMLYILSSIITCIYLLIIAETKWYGDRLQRKKLLLVVLFLNVQGRHY